MKTYTSDISKMSMINAILLGKVFNEPLMTDIFKKSKISKRDEDIIHDHASIHKWKYLHKGDEAYLNKMVSKYGPEGGDNHLLQEFAYHKVSRTLDNILLGGE